MQSSEGPWLSVSGGGPFLSFIKRTQQGGFTSQGRKEGGVGGGLREGEREIGGV